MDEVIFGGPAPVRGVIWGRESKSVRHAPLLAHNQTQPLLKEVIA